MFTGACPLPESTKDSTAPRGTFATCGADGSVRLWHLGWEEQGDAGGEPGDAPIGGDLKRIRGVSTAVSAMYAAPDPSRESAALREVEKQAGLPAMRIVKTEVSTSIAEEASNDPYIVPRTRILVDDDVEKEIEMKTENLAVDPGCAEA